MPVVVTGASGFIGRRAVGAFLLTAPEVRAYVRRADASPALRAQGAKVAVGEIDDLGTLEAVMSGAHTVCHLVGGLDLPNETAYEASNLDSVRAVVEAAGRSGVRRVLFLSYPGASSSAANVYLRFKGLAEEAIEASGLEHVILRSTHVYGSGGAWFEASLQQARRWPALVVGGGRQSIAPIYVQDVAAVLAAADDREAVMSGRFGLEGPDRVTADELADLLAGRKRPKVHAGPRAAARMARLTGRKVSPTLLEVLAAPSLADAPDAAAEFGVSRTALAAGLALSAIPDLRIDLPTRTEED
jgi:uncharacterized protein YbjT (DUF2867 family)